MTLPYDPQNDEAVVVAPLVRALIKIPGGVGHCSKCKSHVWINLITSDFAAKNEAQIICPQCATDFQKGN